MVPAHIWTPWYSLLGARSGYVSPKECLGPLTRFVPALETGLSSDPEMCRRVSSLDAFGLISSSDAHSPESIGREATEFDIDPSFKAIFDAVRPGAAGMLSTVEFFPESGKYHASGHKICGPLGIGERGPCPVCGRQTTEGVSARIAELADRPVGVPDRPFVKLMPLASVLAALTGAGAGSVGVRKLRDKLISAYGPELRILRDISTAEIDIPECPTLPHALDILREGKAAVSPGYDGVYGKIGFGF